MEQQQLHCLWKSITTPLHLPLPPYPLPLPSLSSPQTIKHVYIMVMHLKFTPDHNKGWYGSIYESEVACLNCINHRPGTFCVNKQ